MNCALCGNDIRNADRGADVAGVALLLVRRLAGLLDSGAAGDES